MKTLIFLHCFLLMVLQLMNDIHKERLAAVSFSLLYISFLWTFINLILETLIFLDCILLLAFGR